MPTCVCLCGRLLIASYPIYCAGHNVPKVNAYTRAHACVYSNCPIVTCWRWLARKSESVQHLTQQRRIPRRVTAIVAAYVRVCVCATHRGTYACMNLPLCTVCGSTSRTQGFLRGRLAVTYARTRRIGFVVCPRVCVLVQINM